LNYRNGMPRSGGVRRGEAIVGGKGDSPTTDKYSGYRAKETKKASFVKR